MCKYKFMQCPFYNLIWIGCANVAFVEGLFAKFSVIITWQKVLLFSLKLRWICFRKDKSPLNSNSLLCFQNNSPSFGQINFCTTSKLKILKSWTTFMLGTFLFEPYFRSYFSFTVRSLEFSEITKKSSRLPPPVCFSAFPVAAAVQRCRRSGPAGRPPPACAGRTRVAPDPSPPPFAFALSLPYLATHPDPPAGRHLAAAVDSTG